MKEGRERESTKGRERGREIEGEGESGMDEGEKRNTNIAY